MGSLKTKRQYKNMGQGGKQNKGVLFATSSRSSAIEQLNFLRTGRS